MQILLKTVHEFDTGHHIVLSPFVPRFLCRGRNVHRFASIDPAYLVTRIDLRVHQTPGHVQKECLGMRATRDRLGLRDAGMTHTPRDPRLGLRAGTHRDLPRDACLGLRAETHRP